ncbi:hypothetical protein Ciccas_011629 [Cichlidogyrus casuarinus]|uniref:Uncharacterized protein n=1 Tax=Cichlidogyrus casuarinus TaxID=1844966 RepID=A0ABD2PRK8_9PLAT
MLLGPDLAVKIEFTCKLFSQPGISEKALKDADYIWREWRRDNHRHQVAAKEDVQKYFLPDPMEREIRDRAIGQPGSFIPRKVDGDAENLPRRTSRRTFWLISMGLEEGLKLKLRTHKENPNIEELSSR